MTKSKCIVCAKPIYGEELNDRHGPHVYDPSKGSLLLVAEPTAYRGTIGFAHYPTCYKIACPSHDGKRSASREDD